jgi:hypothetical protein
MVRTQISLSELDRSLLDEQAERSNKSISALIRDAVQVVYGSPSNTQTIEAIQAASGAWEERDYDGEQWVQSLRSGRRLDS